jgi:hypothetical protein
MTRGIAKVVKQVRELTPDELDAVSGGCQWGVGRGQKLDGSLGTLNDPFDVGGKGLAVAACCDGKH